MLDDTPAFFPNVGMVKDERKYLPNMWQILAEGRALVFLSGSFERKAQREDVASRNGFIRC